MPADPKRERISTSQGVFMISVAAELAGMHPQTLRVYEARGLIKPQRSPKGTRLYSQRDVQVLKHIQELTGEFGMNLAGVERVLALEQAMDSMRAQLLQLQEQAELMEEDIASRIEQIHRSYRRDLVRWQPPEAALQPTSRPIRIDIQRRRTGGGDANAAR